MRGWEKFPSPPLLQKISEWRENQEKLVGYIPRKNFKKVFTASAATCSHKKNYKLISN